MPECIVYTKYYKAINFESKKITNKSQFHVLFISIHLSAEVKQKITGSSHSKVTKNNEKYKKTAATVTENKQRRNKPHNTQ
jgi:glutamine synthetase type III